MSVSKGRILERGDWPKEAKCAVIFTFDVMGESIFLQTPELYKVNINRPKLLSQGAVGCEVGLPFVMDVFDKYDIKATFFLCGFVGERFPEVVREMGKRGHDVAFESYMHMSHENLKLDEEKALFEKGNNIIKDLVGKNPRGARIVGQYSPNTWRLLQELGYVYESTWKSVFMPFLAKVGGKETDIVEIPVPWELDDLMQWSEHRMHFVQGYFPQIESPKKVLELWTSEFSGYYEHGMCMVFEFHDLPWHPGRILVLENLIKHIRRYPDVWFATCEDVANWTRERLIGKKFYRPRKGECVESK